VKAALASLLMASLCAASSHAQEPRKLITLPAPSPVEHVSVCGQTGLAAALGRDGSITVFRLASAQVVTRQPAEAGLSNLDCSSDGKLLATSKGDGNVVIADLSGTALRNFTIAGKQIEHLTFSPDSSMVAVQLHESPTQLWDVAHGTLIAALQTNFSGSNSVDFSPDSSRFATADRDTTVRIFERTGNLKAKYTSLLLESFALSFTPDGKQLVVGGADSKLTFLDPGDGHLLRSIPTGSDAVVFAWPLPGGHSLLSAQVDANSLKRFTTLVWNLDTAKSSEIPIDVKTLAGSGVPQKGLAVIFVRDTDTSVTEWALPD
jgi:WD40 repeat protein